MRLFLMMIAITMATACGQQNASAIKEVKITSEKSTRTVNMQATLDDDLVVTKIHKQTTTNWVNETSHHPYAFDIRIRQKNGPSLTPYIHIYNLLAGALGWDKKKLEQLGTITIQFRDRDDRRSPIPYIHVNDRITSLTVCAKPAQAGALSTLWVKSIQLKDGDKFERMYTTCLRGEHYGRLKGKAIDLEAIQKISQMNAAVNGQPVTK